MNVGTMLPDWNMDMEQGLVMSVTKLVTGCCKNDKICIKGLKRLLVKY